MYNLHDNLTEVKVTGSPEVQIGLLLHDQGLKLALAESCTGGLVANRITDVPGSSAYFLGGVVAYAYEAKVDLLDVSWDTLHAHGAVSRETVLEMARGARKSFRADIAASVSVIACPAGGTADKPVGTTWIAVAAPHGEWTRLFHFSGTREQVKASAADAALQFLLDYLEGRLVR